MPAEPRARIYAVVAIFVCSLALNVGYVVAFAPVFTVASDALGYDKIGFDVAEGEGFPVAGGWQPKREPGYPLFLAAIYRLNGHDHQAARLAQAILAASFCVLVFFAARDIGRAGSMPAKVPVVAAALTALYPPFTFYAGVLHRETVLTFFVLLALIALFRAVVDPRPRHVLLFGLCCGVGALVDARMLYFPVFLGGWWALTRREWRRAASVTALSFTTALIVISPWTIRNYVVLDRFVLLTTAPHKGLWIATSPEEFLEWDYTREPLKSWRALPTEERERLMAKEAVENLRKYPGHYVLSSFRRLVRLWLGGGHSNVMPLMEQSLGEAVAAGAWGYAVIKVVFLGVQYLFVLGGAAVAVLCAWRFGVASVGPALAFPAYLCIVHMALFATPRYNIPAMPVLIIFLAYGVVTLALRRPAALAKPALHTLGSPPPAASMSGARGRADG